MTKLHRAALLAAALSIAPAAHAGDFFVNGQAGRIELDNAFGDQKTNLLQASAGYRWGLDNVQVGIEAGGGKLADLEGEARTDFAGGYSTDAYTLATRYAFVGANARIKPPLLPVFFIARAGYTGYEQKFDHTMVDQFVDAAPVTERRESKEHGGGVYYGAGIGTSILPLLDVSLMLNEQRTRTVQYDPIADEYHLSDDEDGARSVSLSVEYRF